MTTPRDPNAMLAAYLDEGMTVLPDRVITSVLDEAHRTHQRTVFRPWATRSTFTATLSAAAVVALLVVGAALLQRGRLDVSAPSTSPEASASPTPPAVVTVTPTPTAEVLSLDLTWTEVDIEAGPGQVAWLGDRFALVDSSGAVRTSIDGLTWDVLRPGDPDPGYADLLWDWTSIATWEDDIVGWWNPEDGPEIAGKPPITSRDVLRIVQPPAQPIVTTPFEGRIESIGVGPLGIVAHVHSRLNYATEDNWDAWVTKKLGLRTNNDWTCCVKGVTFENGVLQIELNNGPGLHVVWADEGFLPGDYQDRGFGWYSPDGVEWTAIPSDVAPSLDRGDRPSFVTGMGTVVGVSDGFIVAGDTPQDTCTLADGCSGMWHSADGLTWRNLGHPDADPDALSGRLVPWKGGALETDGVGVFNLWTSQGYSELPMSADFPTPGEAQDPYSAPFVTGPLGLVSIRLDSMEVLVTRDGSDWKIGSLPSAMLTDSDYQMGPSVAVGDRSVLYLTWSGYWGEGEGYVPSLWLGTVEP
jgi:hypothetical protein